MESNLKSHVLTDSEAEEIVALRHADPHALLGLHAIPGGLVLRAFRPGAERIRALFSGQIRPLLRVHPSGIFELVLPGQDQKFPYLLEAEDEGRGDSLFLDPYAFLPALGESGFRSLQSGRHEDAWNRMGACEGFYGGIQGVAFAAWEPLALGVSVAGDFNGWNGRLHQLRRTAVTGLWEIFIPAIPSSSKYRFEVRRDAVAAKLS